jgi:hypothetical protein
MTAAVVAAYSLSVSRRTRAGMKSSAGREGHERLPLPFAPGEEPGPFVEPVSSNWVLLSI